MPSILAHRFDVTIGCDEDAIDTIDADVNCLTVWAATMVEEPRHISLQNVTFSSWTQLKT